MSSLKSKDRVSLCSFTFSDGRHCRTPRLRDNPRFCPYHAQKEARAQAAESLGKDLDYFFSGDYLSACDLSTALGRLIPAVVRGEVKPRAARTVAYLAQTLLQAIHLAKHEYINAFGTDGWRQSIHNSVRGNYDYRFPPAPNPNSRNPLNLIPRSLNLSPPKRPPPSPSRPQQIVIPRETRDLLLLLARHSPLTTRHFPTLPCLPRAPNSLRMYWPVGTCPDPVGRPLRVSLHNRRSRPRRDQFRLRPPRQSQHKPLQLHPPPHLQLHPKPNNRRSRLPRASRGPCRDPPQPRHPPRLNPHP